MSKPGSDQYYHKTPTSLFVRGPIPLPWLAAAYAAGGSALAVGICLWYIRGFKNSKEEIAFPIKRAEEALGVSRWAADRGLRRLEEAGLIANSKKQGRAGRVTILDAPTKGGK